jgi:glycosyltransferase involved in cell wall biosynthesis
MVITLVGFEEKGHDAYFQKVKVREDGTTVRLLDAMIGHVKYPFLGNARAFLFPIHWEEPFGLVMVEAMACGTPVIGYDRGSVSEVVQDAVTGFVVAPGSGVAGLVEAISRIGEIDRARCRKRVEEKFTIQKMVEGYEKVYTSIL